MTHLTAAVVYSTTEQVWNVAIRDAEGTVKNGMISEVCIKGKAMAF